jgi:hypothetical protein
MRRHLLACTRQLSPLAEGFRGHEDLTDAQPCFHITMAESKVKIQPASVADELTRETRACGQFVEAEVITATPHMDMAG